MDPSELSKWLWRQTFGRNKIFSTIISIIFLTISAAFYLCNNTSICIFQNIKKHGSTTGIKEKVVWIVPSLEQGDINVGHQLGVQIFGNEYRLQQHSDSDYQKCKTQTLSTTCPTYTVSFTKLVEMSAQEKLAYGFTANVSIDYSITLNGYESSILDSRSYSAVGFGWSEISAEKRAVTVLLEKINQIKL